MLRILAGLILGLWITQSIAAVERASPPSPRAQPAPQAKPATPDSRQLEKQLQSLKWPQFKAVVTAIPPIKAEVDKYGLLGWQYVQQHYQTYPWSGTIDRLQNWQKLELVKLIENAKKLR